MFDGFDFGDKDHRWTAASMLSLSTSNSRTGTHKARVSGSTSSCWHSFLPSEIDDEIYMGFGFFAEGIGSNINILTFQEGYGTTNHLALIRNSPVRGWELRRGTGPQWPATGAAGTVVAATVPNLWFPDSWHHLELGMKIHDSTGWFELRQDGITRLRFDGDTNNGGAAGLIDQVRLNVITNGGIWGIDDVHILNSLGSIPALTTWLGDTRMYPLYPIGDGFYLMLVGSDADSIDNWILVDETGTPITTDFVFSATVGDKDTYEFSDLPVTVGTVRGIEIRVHAAKSDTGTKQFRTIDRRAGADAFQADHALAAVPLYQTHHDILEQDPHAGPGDWTIPNVNATEWGMEVRS